MKPILTFRDGLVYDQGVVRGYSKAVDQVLEQYSQKAHFGGEAFLFHADRQELAEEAEKRLLEIDP